MTVDEGTANVFESQEKITDKKYCAIGHLGDSLRTSYSEAIESKQ